MPLFVPKPPSAVDVAETISTPGANMAIADERFENRATPSSLSVAPTATTVEMQAGRPIMPSEPELPADVTVATRRLRSSSTAALRGSPSHSTNTSAEPRLVLAAASGTPSLSTRSSRYSSAAIWSDMNDVTQEPVGAHSSLRWNTWIAMISAAGAAPRSEPAEPAAMPATWGPWSQMLRPWARHASVSIFAAPTPICSFDPFGQRLTSPLEGVEKQASRITRPAKKG